MTTAVKVSQGVRGGVHRFKNMEAVEYQGRLYVLRTIRDTPEFWCLSHESAEGWRSMNYGVGDLVLISVLAGLFVEAANGK